MPIWRVFITLEVVKYLNHVQEFNTDSRSHTPSNTISLQIAISKINRSIFNLRNIDHSRFETFGSNGQPIYTDSSTVLPKRQRLK